METFPEAIKWVLILATIIGIASLIWWLWVDDSDDDPKTRQLFGFFLIWQASRLGYKFGLRKLIVIMFLLSFAVLHQLSPETQKKVLEFGMKTESQIQQLKDKITDNRNNQAK